VHLEKVEKKLFILKINLYIYLNFKKLNTMNNFIQSYKLILEELSKNCQHITNFRQIKQPKLSNLELTVLNLTVEYFYINTECQLFRTIKGTKLEFKIYNKRRRKLFGYMEEIRKCLSDKFTEFTDVFIVDSTPIEICKIGIAKRSGICSTDAILPAFGYCAAQKSRYFVYKLHAVCDKNGFFHTFDLTPVNVHDVNYLKDIKNNFKNRTLIGDRGYISADYQLDLFNYSNIN